MMPLWVALIGVLGTVIGAIIGSLITQRRADRRERETWERQSERERALWVREDAARTFEQRRTAYVDFYQASIEAGELFTLHTWAHMLGNNGADLPELSTTNPSDHLPALYMYATPKVRDLAGQANHLYIRMKGAFAELKRDPSNDKVDEYGDQWDAALEKLLEAMRKDLGIPDDTLSDLAARRSD
jgi:hypothetical protein